MVGTWGNPHLPSPAECFLASPPPRLVITEVEEDLSFYFSLGQVFEFFRLTDWGGKSPPSVTPSLLAPPGGSIKICGVFFFFFIDLFANLFSFMELRLPWCWKTLLPKSLMLYLQHTQVLRQTRQEEQPWPEGLWNKESQLTDTTSWDESICFKSLVSLQGCAIWASLEKGLRWRFALITKTALAFLLCEWCRRDLLNVHA